jgi:hypothetical protein
VDALATGRQLAGGAGVSGAGGFGGGGRGGGAFGGSELSAAAAPAQVPAVRTTEADVAKREDGLLRARIEPTQGNAKSDSNTAPAPVEEKRMADKLAQADQPQPERFAKAAARPAQSGVDSEAVPTTRPSAVESDGSRRGVNDIVQAKAAYGGYNVSAGTVVLQQQRQQQLTDHLSEIDTACVVIARDMNGQQVRELARSLSQPERNLFATVQLENADSYRHTTLGTLGRTDTNDWALRAPNFARPVQENELMLKDRAAANAPAVVGPATRPAPELSLAIKPEEAGLSRAEGDKTVNGTVAATERFHYGVDLSGDAKQVPVQQGAYFAANPTTQPLAGLKPDVFTCVIVVQNNSTVRAAGATTQPVVGKPTTTAPTEPPPAAAKEAK